MTDKHGPGHQPDRLTGDRGAAAEYALIAALIAVAIVAAVTFFGGNVAALFDDAGSAFPG